MPAPARGARARSLPARGAGLLQPHVRMNVDRGSGSGSGADGARFAARPIPPTSALPSPCEPVAPAPTGRAAGRRHAAGDRRRAPARESRRAPAFLRRGRAEGSGDAGPGVKVRWQARRVHTSRLDWQRPPSGGFSLDRVVLGHRPAASRRGRPQNAFRRGCRTHASVELAAFAWSVHLRAACLPACLCRPERRGVLCCSLASLHVVLAVKVCAHRVRWRPAAVCEP